MYCLRVLFSGFFLGWLQPHPAMAQERYQSETIQGYELNLQNIIFDSTSGHICKIALRDYGLAKSNYAVLLSASVDGDTVVHHIPGIVNSEDSFGFRLKPGNRNVGDTLFIIRRSGEKPILFSRIRILAFRSKRRNGVMQSDKDFTAFLLTKYVRGSAFYKCALASYYVENQ